MLPDAKSGGSSGFGAEPFDAAIRMEARPGSGLINRVLTQISGNLYARPLARVIAFQAALKGRLQLLGLIH